MMRSHTSPQQLLLILLVLGGNGWSFQWPSQAASAANEGRSLGATGMFATAGATSFGSIPWKGVAAGTIIAGCLYGIACLKVVTTGNECLVERWGRFHRRLGPGYHWIHRPFESISYEATLREQIMDVPPQQCFTLDNAPLKADTVVYMRILSTERARYAVDDLENAILNLCLTQLREQVGKLTLDQSFASRDIINKALLSGMNEICEKDWGVQITRVEIQNLEPSPDILQAMELQMAAERQKRAAILKSEGERRAQENEAQGKAFEIVTDARARKESIQELAQAEADRVRVESEGLRTALESIMSALSTHTSSGNTSDPTDVAVQVLLMTRYLEVQTRLAESENSKVLLFPTKDSIPMMTPGNMENLFGLVSGTSRSNAK